MTEQKFDKYDVFKCIVRLRVDKGDWRHSKGSLQILFETFMVTNIRILY